VKAISQKPSKRTASQSQAAGEETLRSHAQALGTHGFWTTPRDTDLPDFLAAGYIARLPIFEARAGGACSGGRRVSIRIAGLTLAAVYEREVAASLERIWENVLDWEHLPWLHRRSFLGIREVEAGPSGWRACVLLPQPGEPRPAWIQVCLDRASLRYVTRTLAGMGEGTEIWTLLDPVTDRRTRVTVEFHLPRSAATQGAGNREVGAVYTQLYTRLWNEDEGMMVRRQAVLDARGAPATRDPSVVPLGSASSLRAQLPRVIDADGARLRIVEVAGKLCAHTTVCPHLGGPLEEAMLDADGCIVCPWHGYRFDLRTGLSADGRRLALSAAPELQENATGEVSLVWDPA
jgi:nitrite reductase/ring-hydroxylating ferredoxin subunit